MEYGEPGGRDRQQGRAGTLDFESWNPKLWTVRPRESTINPKPETLNPKPSTLTEQVAKADHWPELHALICVVSDEKKKVGLCDVGFRIWGRDCQQRKDKKGLVCGIGPRYFT